MGQQLWPATFGAGTPHHQPGVLAEPLGADDVDRLQVFLARHAATSPTSTKCTGQFRSGLGLYAQPAPVGVAVIEQRQPVLVSLGRGFAAAPLGPSSASTAAMRARALSLSR